MHQFKMNTHIIVVLIVVIANQTCADEWRKPNAWESHLPSAVDPDNCPVCDGVKDSALAVLYYRKLIRTLFNKDKMQKNEFTGKLQRAILFSLSPAQLTTIEESTDIRDLDEIVTFALTTATIPRKEDGTMKHEGFIWLVNDVLKDSNNILKIILSNSEASFAIFVLGVSLAIWFIHKRSQKSIFGIVILGFVLFGYFYTYVECNRALEAEDTIAFLKKSEPEEKGWFRKMFNTLFSKSEPDEQILRIQNKSKIKLPFCRPDHVLMMYINEMFLNQLKLVTQKMVEMLINFKDLMPFPYNIISMVALPFIFMSIIKLIFKYIFNPILWSRTMYGNRTHQQSQHQQPNIGEDRISGANLEKLLDMFQSTHNKKREELSSGVQEILEPLDAKNESVESTCNNNDESNEIIKKIDVEQEKDIRES